MILGLQLLTYNGSEYLYGLFESLAAQTDKDWVLYVLDNNSIDRERVAEIIREYEGRFEIVYGESDVNLGFSGGHQALFEGHESDLVMLVNQDVLYSADYIERVRAVFEDSEVGAAAGVVFRWDWEVGDYGEFVSSDGGRVILKSGVLDSVGLRVLPWFEVRDIGSGVEFEGFDFDLDVWGISGCTPMYRRSAVLASSFGGVLFDSEYGSYKEDVDLAFRLRCGGFKTRIVGDAYVWHKRSFGRHVERSSIGYYSLMSSYRNHLLNLLTHVFMKDMVIYGVAIVFYEVLKFCYYLIVSPRVLWNSWRWVWGYLGVIREKRRFYAGRCHD